MSYLATLNEPGANCHVECRWPIFGAKLEAWRLKMFPIFNFFNLAWFLKLEIPFGAYLKQFPVRKVP